MTLGDNKLQWLGTATEARPQSYSRERRITPDLPIPEINFRNELIVAGVDVARCEVSTRRFVTHADRPFRGVPLDLTELRLLLTVERTQNPTVRAGEFDDAHCGQGSSCRCPRYIYNT